MEMGMPAIAARDLKRAYHSGDGVFWALKGASLDIAPGALTILSGRSGSGKTTLMNIMGALDEPTEGSVRYGENDITQMRGAERDALRRQSVGFIFQSIALIPTMSAYENVEFAMRVAGKTAHTQRVERTEECLRLVGLAQRGKHMPQELSGGEQQRVAIARAIAHRPSVVFADEPTAELDTRTALQVAKIFRSLVDKERMTIVMATHDMSLLDIADAIYVLEDGEIANANI